MTAASVRAGKAHVELGVLDKTQQALAAAQKRLSAFAKSAAKIGAAVSRAGASILDPLTAATFQFAAQGDAVHKMAARTGVSAEAISELGFAAEQSGASAAEVETAFKGLGQKIMQLEKGSTEAAFVFDKLGLSLADLQNMPADKQMELIADRLTQVQNASERAAIATQIFGEGGQKLGPMFADGAAGIQALRAEARDLGRSIGPEQAEAAAAMTDAWNRVKSSCNAITLTIGGALAPALTEISNFILPIVKTVREWIAANSSLIRILAIVGVALTAAGAVIAAIAGGAAMLGMALGAVSTVLGIIGPIFAALVSPVGIAVTAIAAAGVAFLRFTETGRQMYATAAETLGRLWSWVKTVFAGIWAAVGSGDLALAAEIAWAAVQVAVSAAVDWIVGLVRGLKDDWGETFNAILNALTSGDFGGAAEIAFGALQTAWSQGIANLLGAWGDYIKSIVQTFAGAMQQIAKLWIQTQGGISKGILSMAENKGIVGDMMAKLLGVDVREEQAKRDKMAAELDPVRRRNLEWSIAQNETALQTATDPEEIARLKAANAQFQTELGRPVTDQSVADEAAGAIDAQTAASTAAVEDMVGRSLSGMDRWMNAAQSRADQSATAQTARIEAANEAAAGPGWNDQARQNLADLLAKADLLKPGSPGLNRPDIPPPPDMDDTLQRAAQLPNMATSSAWAVQAMFAGLVGPTKPEEETARNTKRTVSAVEDLRNIVRNRKGVVFL